MNKLEIIITQNHIDRGIPCSPRKCPIALALSEALPDATTVRVGATEFYLERDGAWEVWKMDEEMIRFRRAFDEYRAIGSIPHFRARPGGWAPGERLAVPGRYLASPISCESRQSFLARAGREKD